MALVIGETIGNFKIVQQLGSGGMGEVYLAEQTSIGTKVAVKVLRPNVSKDTEHVQRFFNEARAVSKIQHAGIVKIFDVGYAQGGEAYLIMEFLEGETLAHRIERVGALPLEQIADLGKQIASVLGATHGAGITHRDLKPDNIYIIADRELPRGERVKILDFGIAKLTGTLAGASPQTIGTMGTPAYMAPEQWGDASKVDWRADVYSLGCVAFEMATGRPPFIVTTIAEACAMHLHDIPPRARTIVPTLPAALDELLARLLEKKPEARPQSMQELARAFEAIGEGRGSALVAAAAPAMTKATLPPQVAGTAPTLASGESFAAPAPKQRSKAPLLVVAGVVLVGGAGAATYLAVSKDEHHAAGKLDAGVVVAQHVPHADAPHAPPAPPPPPVDAAAPPPVDAAAPVEPPRPPHPTGPTHGTIDRKAIDALVEQHHAQLAHCAKRPAKIDLKLVVETDGFPTQVSTTAIDPNVDACIVEQIEKLQFPKPHGGSAPYSTTLDLEPTGGAPGGEEGPFGRAAVRATMQKIRPELEACGVHGRGAARLTIDTNGRVKNVALLGGLEGSPAGDCLIAAIKRAEFPKPPHQAGITVQLTIR